MTARLNEKWKPYCSRQKGIIEQKPYYSKKYRKESEIVKAYGKEILNLPYISSAKPRKIKEFSEKLTYYVPSLQMLKKSDEMKGFTVMILHKLPAIRGDLERTDKDRESWDFCELSEVLSIWI